MEKAADTAHKPSRDFSLVESSIYLKIPLNFLSSGVGGATVRVSHTGS